MTRSTRDQFLHAARRLFAERGFYGVSIANIADELGLTKQALLHHFKNKEKLYGEVLGQISDELEAICQGAQNSEHTPAAQLKTFFLRIIATKQSEYIRTRLLMRELLDNQPRADKAAAWPLRPFLTELIKMAKAVPAWENATDAQALALIYQLLGAVNYYGVSEPTLRGIFGASGFSALKKAFEPQFETMIDAALTHPPQ